VATYWPAREWLAAISYSDSRAMLSNYMNKNDITVFLSFINQANVHTERSSGRFC
jgi:hypothetical protein